VPAKAGLGKFACLLTLIAGGGLLATVLEDFGATAFVAVISVWALGLLLTMISFFSNRGKGWAILSLVLSLGIGGWLISRTV
jgi:hypothetical protein